MDYSPYGISFTAWVDVFGEKSMSLSWLPVPA